MSAQYSGEIDPKPKLCLAYCIEFTQMQIEKRQ